MPRALTLGNGSMLVCIDKYAQVRDLYFPYVGLENHVGGHNVHRIGVWVDNTLKWTNDPTWSIDIGSDADALEGLSTAVNESLGVTLSFRDLVYNEENIFIRKIRVKNTSDRPRRIHVYLGHEFEIYESHRGDTAYYDPTTQNVIHYNGARVLLIGGRYEGRPFDEYTTGIFNIYGKQGSFKDAEDGALTDNPIEHGPTDSVVGFYADFEAGEEKTIRYWLIAATSLKDAHEQQNSILGRTPDHLIRTSHDFWDAWVHKQSFSFHDLDDDIVTLFKKSLFIIRAHTDNKGAVIASGDSDMLQGGKDTYSYMWPRDSARVATALDMAGDPNISQRLYLFCNDVITDDGYFMHKYRPDKSLGSSWHPWVRDGKPSLPIQEDETALVIYSLWTHYRKSKDLEFIESVYNSLIKKAADFLASFVDHKTGLPKSSYDLWEEKYGVSTFTASSVYGALNAAANFAELLGKDDSAMYYRESSSTIRRAILEHLYDESESMFYKMISYKPNGEVVIDRTFDMSSIYGVYRFKVLDIDDPRLTKAIGHVEAKLYCHTEIGGIARYEGDEYYRTDKNIPGNPWIITSLWYAQYFISRAKNEEDFDEVRKWLKWVVKYALPSGVLSEQLDTHTGEQVSASPLTWSHAEFVITVIKYLDKHEELGLCDDCDPLYNPK